MGMSSVKMIEDMGKSVREKVLKVYNSKFVLFLRLVVALAMLGAFCLSQFRPSQFPEPLRSLRKRLPVSLRKRLRKHNYGKQFHDYSWDMARRMSHPQIMYKAQLQNGKTIIVDDYREAYWYLRDKTPEDSRVMAWWDYGYQITGIGNRTSIADGNTWNHEHIATLGWCLTSEQNKAHKVVRHLADYLLVWTGGGGDDLAKSPHMARIGNSVYNDICPNDPTCQKFGFYGRGKPTPMMRKSLLYNLHGHNQIPGVKLNEKLYKEVFTSKYNKVRIYKVLKVDQRSKKWNADPKNRKCDAPGSWYCEGRYPPHKRVMDLIRSRRNFAQLEDFNVGMNRAAKEYTKKYMENMAKITGKN